MPKKPATSSRTTSVETEPRVRLLASQQSASRRVPVRPGMLLDLRVPIDVQLSPDGAYVAFILQERVAGRRKPRGKLWIIPAEGGEPRPLALAEGDDACPRWSPDGTQLAFLSTRVPARYAGKSEVAREGADPADRKWQVYLATMTRGTAKDVRRLTEMPNGASDLAWAPDGSRISFLSREGGASKDAKDGPDPLVVVPERHRRLWSLRPGYDRAEPLTPPDVTIWEYAWSPDGQQIAVFFSEGPNETDYYRGQLGLVSATGGAVRQLGSLDHQAAALAWSPDGARLAYVSGEWSDRGLVGGDVYVLDLRQDELATHNLTPAITLSPSWIQWLPDGTRLLYAAWDGLAGQIGVLDAATGEVTPVQREFVMGEGFQPRFSASVDRRRLALTHSDAQAHPFDIFVGDLTATSITWRRLSRLNPLSEETCVVQASKRLSYTSVDGWRIEALFHPPAVRRFQGKPPLVVIVHGGPSTAHVDAWGGRFMAQVLTSAGYAVLRPNPRGSLGRGVEFADAVLGDMGGKDLQDILCGVDEVIRQELVDGARVGIIGWSYGGFMTAWAVAQTQRFKAAMMGAGICDFHSFHAQSNIPDWDMRFLRADPSRQPEAYRARSAITFAGNVTTPTLILHGEKDPCVPVNQAYAFHRALTERGIPTELVVYPREGHGLQETAHVKDMEERILRWMQQYV